MWKWRMDTGHEDGWQQGRLFSSLIKSSGTKVKKKMVIKYRGLDSLSGNSQ